MKNIKLFTNYELKQYFFKDINFKTYQIQKAFKFYTNKDNNMLCKELSLNEFVENLNELLYISLTKKYGNADIIKIKTDFNKNDIIGFICYFDGFIMHFTKNTKDQEINLI